jgi:hypothetical protein
VRLTVSWSKGRASSMFLRVELRLPSSDSTLEAASLAEETCRPARYASVPYVTKHFSVTAPVEDRHRGAGPRAERRDGEGRLTALASNAAMALS